MSERIFELDSSMASTDGANEESFCFHCQLPVPVGADYRLTIDGQEQQMCCPGCQAAAAMVVDADLTEYYRYREICEVDDLALAKAGERKSSDRNEADRREFESYAKPDYMAQYCRKSETGEIEADLIISGIRCAACVWLLEKFLLALPGVTKASVNLASHRAFITFDPAQTPVVDIFFAVNRLGYQGYPYVPSVEESLHQQQKSRLLKALGISAIGMMQVMMFTIALYAGAFEGISERFELLLRYGSLVVTTPVVFYSARLFFINAWRDLSNRQMGMDVPVSLAIGVAYLASLVNTFWLDGEVYYESVSMFTFFLLTSRFVELKAREQQSISTNELVSVLPSFALKLAPDEPLEQSKTQSVLLSELAVGDRILIENGATIAADGKILHGNSQIDESAFSGESLPLERSVGEQVYAGSVNMQNPLVIEVTALPSQSVLSNMVRLAQRAAAQKPSLALLADSIAGYFVFIVLFIALSAGIYWWFVDTSQVLAIVLAVLVVSCPCALSLATPVALAVANRRMMRLGLMPTTGQLLTGLSSADSVLFDKTGTLTEGKLKLQQVNAFGDLDTVLALRIAMTLESGVNHPLAQALIVHGEQLGLTPLLAEQQQVIQGRGVRAVIDGVDYAIGNQAFVAELLDTDGHRFSGEDLQSQAGICVSLVNVSKQQIVAHICFSDVIREDAKALVSFIKRQRKQVIMVSGDGKETCNSVAQQLGIETIYHGMKPDEKIELVNQLIANGRKVMMVGDGINDAAALQQAHVSVAMNQAAEFVQAKADGVLLSEKLSVLGQALVLAERCYATTKQNMGWALAYNMSTLPLAAFGLIPPWLAALGMSLSSLIVLVNSYLLANKDLNKYGVL